jgi:hypothetical protein
VGVGVGVALGVGVGLVVAGAELDWERLVVGGGVDGGVGGDGRESGEITWGTPPGACSVGGDFGCGWLWGPNEKLEVMA